MSGILADEAAADEQVAGLLASIERYKRSAQDPQLYDDFEAWLREVATLPEAMRRRLLFGMTLNLACIQTSDPGVARGG